MSEEKVNAISAEVKVVDGILIVSAKADIVEALRELAKQSDNTIDDVLVSIVAAAKDNMDWKGVAKGLL